MKKITKKSSYWNDQETEHTTWFEIQETLQTGSQWILIQRVITDQFGKAIESIIKQPDLSEIKFKILFRFKLDQAFLDIVPFRDYSAYVKYAGYHSFEPTKEIYYNSLVESFSAKGLLHFIVENTPKVFSEQLPAVTPVPLDVLITEISHLQYVIETSEEDSEEAQKAQARLDQLVESLRVG